MAAAHAICGMCGWPGRTRRLQSRLVPDALYDSEQKEGAGQARPRCPVKTSNALTDQDEDNADQLSGEYD
jgi:hypothetical protein